MRSLSYVVGVLLASGALAIVPPAPVITAGPDAASIEAVRRDGPDAISLANILLTAVPASLREIAATNIPAASKILWSEFLDNNKPSWFTALPTDVQSYLVHEFGPKTSVSASTTQSTSQSQSTSPSSSQSRTTSSAESSSSLSSVSSAATRSASDTTAGLPIAAPSTSPSTDPRPLNSGLSKGEKIGIGVGVALAILAIAALVVACCLLLRRRRRRRRDFSSPPSSPGFIPRSAFHEKTAADDWSPHRPLHGDGALSTADLNRSELDGDAVYDDTPSSRVQNGHQPIMAPAVFHSHSSNRARGKRTSYTSLHSVPEEPVSPVTPRTSPPRRNLVNPEVAAIPQVKRKPVPKAGTNNGALFPNANGHNRNASDVASQRLFQQHMGHNMSNGSPPEERNPFGNQYSYEEDYGPEYHNGYKDLEGGQSVHPAFRQPTLENSRTEWPLRSVGANGHQRNKSPLWDRVYDGT